MTKRTKGKHECIPFRHRLPQRCVLIHLPTIWRHHLTAHARASLVFIISFPHTAHPKGRMYIHTEIMPPERVSAGSMTSLASHGYAWVRLRLYLGVLQSGMPRRELCCRQHRLHAAKRRRSLSRSGPRRLHLGPRPPSNLPGGASPQTASFRSSAAPSTSSHVPGGLTGHFTVHARSWNFQIKMPNER